MLGVNVLYNLDKFNLPDVDLNLELATSLDRLNYILQPSVQINLGNGKNLEVGANIIGGDTDATLGRFKGDNRVFFNFNWAHSFLK
jgi:hypothetical protein